MGNHCEWQGGPRRQEETEVSRICPWPCLASCCLATEAEKARFVITVPSTTQFKAACHFIIASGNLLGLILCILWLNCVTINQCWDSTHSERCLNNCTTIILHVSSYGYVCIFVPKAESVHDYYSIATIETLWYLATDKVSMKRVVVSLMHPTTPGPSPPLCVGRETCVWLETVEQYWTNRLWRCYA